MIVLLPGSDGTGALFGPLIEQIAAETLVISYPHDARLGYAELETRVRSELPTSRNYVVLGESFAGPLAISLAARPPANLKGIVLSASFAASPWAGSFVWRRLIPLLRWRPPIQLMSALLMGSQATPELERQLDAALGVVQMGVLRHRLTSALAVDYRAQLQCVRLPLLYLRAEHDRVVPRRCAREIQKWAPHTEIQSFDAPHFLLQCQPVRAATSIESFYRNHGD